MKLSKSRKHAAAGTDRRLDSVLEEEGSLIFGKQVVADTSKGIKIRRAPSGRKVAGMVKKQGGALTANDLKKILGQISKRTPEVMVKITGGGKGGAHLAAHIDYVSRNGELEGGLEDHDGNVYESKEDIALLKDSWRYGGWLSDSADDGRDSYNVVLSMPAGTNPDLLRRAVRDFAADEFAGREYIMALHTPETDPDKNPPRHPHVHLTIKARDERGLRMNPKKADLQRWREGFAEALRSYGLEATATRRYQRGQRTYAQKHAVGKMRSRGVKLTKIGRGATPARVAQAVETDEKIMKSYGRMTEALSASEAPEDRRLAESMSERFGADRVGGTGRRKPVGERTKSPDRER